MDRRPPRLTDAQYNRRSHARSARVDLLMSPELRDRIDAAAAAAGRRRIPYLLALIEQHLPPELELDDGQEPQEARMAG